jgi:rare lipoprotein A (peptidoglycan hydrolase)
MTVDPNALEEESLSKSDGSHTASTLIGLLLVAAVFALIYFYVLPASASTQCGDASWHEAKSNSCGSFTAAHRSPSFGSKIQIENLPIEDSSELLEPITERTMLLRAIAK